jgi:hypothetical protein
MLTETPLAAVEQRTEWNVRDADAVLILIPGPGFAKSAGTEFTKDAAVRLGRKHLAVNMLNPDSVQHATSWLKALPDLRVLNIAGPRLSEAAGVDEQTKKFLKKLFR